MPVNSNVGVAVVPGIPNVLYSDSLAPIHLNSTNGTTTTNTPAAAFSSTYGGGLGTDSSGRLFYIASTAAGVQHLWRFNSPTAAAVDIGVITSSVPGDPIWPVLSPGDMMSDGNGRLYYFGSDYAPQANGLFNNYLYFVDANLVAHRLGSYQAAQVGIGVAFDPVGIIYTLNRNLLFRIDLSAGFSATFIGNTGNNSLIDLGSCALPNLNPNFVSPNKAVRDVTTNQNSPTTVNTSDILEYSVAIINTGTLPSDNTRFIDAIPGGTSYVLGSTQLCNATASTCSTVPDVAGSAPFLVNGGIQVNTAGQAAGIVLSSSANAAVVRFRVRVTSVGIPSNIVNTGQINYPTVNAGVIIPTLLPTTTTTVSVTVPTVTLSGTVFDDSDGSRVRNATEALTSLNGLNAVLVNISSGNVVATTPVVAGAFSFNNVAINTNYTLRITTATATVDSPPPAVVLPSEWVSTGENLNGVVDGVIDGILSVPVASANVPNVNIGIEQPPTAVAGLATSQANPGGTATVSVPASLFTGSTDPEATTGGSVTQYRFTAFPQNATSIRINGTNYTAGSFPLAGITVTTAQLSGLVVDPLDGVPMVGILFQAIDNAGQVSSNTAIVILPFNITTNAQVLLVKRVTAINGLAQNPHDQTPLNQFVDDTTSIYAANDNNPNWPVGYLLGAINGGRVQSGDTIEYTVYFLNAGGANADATRVCDRISPNQSFQFATYGPNQDIQIQIGTNQPQPLTAANDGNDRAQLYAANAAVPNTCNLNVNAPNTNGTVAVDVTGASGTGIPNLTTLSGSTGPGTPNTSYGLIRFRTLVP